jgi:hypothetical protein
MSAFTGFALAILTAQTGAAQAVPVPPSPCAGPRYQGFDFWVGDWDVYPSGSETLVAHSRIEKLYGGCAIRENWMPVKGAGGGSLNTLDPATGRWHQYWVDSQGSRVEFDGGPAGGGMILTGFWRGVGGSGKDGLIRMSYMPLGPSSVRQHGELSVDQGLTWTTSFDFIYRRSNADK